MYRPNKIMKAGTWADPDFNGAAAYNAQGRTAVLDMNAGEPGLARDRGDGVRALVPEPDAACRTGRFSRAAAACRRPTGTDLTKAVLPAEIWNPDTETWTTVASLQNGRDYHSTALLLPDGRVLMAGGGSLPGSRRRPEERRDLLAAVPLQGRAADDHGGALRGRLRVELRRDDAERRADREGLADPVAAVTHAFDQNQRFQFLNFTTGSGKITVQAPATANLAPPGDYMLFLIDSNGVPSVGSIVRMSASGDTTPPTAPTGLDGNADTGTGRARLGRLDRRRRHSRATASTALPRPASRRAPSTGSPSRPARATPTSAARRDLLLQGHGRRHQR